jgi:glucose-1-phosphate cytidylyltransferase
VKAVILAGGVGTRISEETVLRPKPMVEIGGKPMLWHIMKSYSAQGIDEFVVCLGYRGYQIKEYFANYRLHTSDVTFDLGRDQMTIHESTTEPWRVTLVDTGDTTMTGGRLKRVLPHLGDEEFCFTYGDGLSDLDIGALVEFHRGAGVLATVTAVQPAGRYGALDVTDDRVHGFREKPLGDGGWVNGGFFVLSPEVGRYIEGDETLWEREPLERLAADGELAAYRHAGFWYAMDTLRDRNHLEELWESGDPPWRTWERAPARGAP